MLRRRCLWLRIGVGAAAGVVGGVLAIVATPSVYAASASVLVAGSEVNMSTEAQLVRSTRTSADAFARITGDPAHPEAVGRLVSVQPVPGAAILVIIFEARSADLARAGATAFAEAYLAARADATRAGVDSEIAAVRRQLDDVQAQLGQVNTQLAQLPSRSPEIDSLHATQSSLSAQVASLTVRLGELRTTTVDPGRIVAQAALPTAPVRPDRAAYLGVAVATGLAGGVLADLLRTRWSRRVRNGTDLHRHRLALLAELEPAALATAGGHQDPNGRAFGRLRNELVASLEPSEHVLLVTGAAPGTASTLVAASMAAAFARGDNDVVVVGANVPDDLPWQRAEPDQARQRPVTLAAIFDLGHIPGLTDVLTGRATLARAVQRAARAPRLQVVTPGGTATASGLLQAQAAHSVLRQLATRCRYVIVDAPSTASGADAQSLAAAADVALLVVEAGHTQHAQVADAATQLARVGTRLLGAVLVPGREVLGPHGLRSMSTNGAATPELVSEEGSASRTLAVLDEPTTQLEPLDGRNPPRESRDEEPVA